ncbi:hypothetical protein NEOLI_004422 [Neolecta irregularis DAH-3]|uniref:Uncharacterized protein n=1 Tax=Neolecta irregularis (strain DAH-3) TaxID=1198029 RepID=A0A1U7LUS5_NEOID|nr:hypothetical protein NEOLI_004422 [Neolecta irregularis DAH-3]|eukprot:OLL26368.1 hypothetical protein NEOLI_004422 [Neolecta irregularis DAH-3]
MKLWTAIIPKRKSKGKKPDNQSSPLIPDGSEGRPNETETLLNGVTRDMDLKSANDELVQKTSRLNAELSLHSLNDEIRTTQYQKLEQKATSLKQQLDAERLEKRILESRIVEIIQESEKIKTQFVVANRPGDVDLKDDRYYIEGTSQIVSEIRQWTVKYFRNQVPGSNISESSTMKEWLGRIIPTEWGLVQGELVRNRKLRIAAIRGFVIMNICEWIFGRLYPLAIAEIGNSFALMYDKLCGVNRERATRWRVEYFKTLNTDDVVEREEASIRMFSGYVLQNLPATSATKSAHTSLTKICGRAYQLAIDIRCEEGDVDVGTMNEGMSGMNGMNLGSREDQGSREVDQGRVLEQSGDHSIEGIDRITIVCEPMVLRRVDMNEKGVMLREVGISVFEYQERVE